MTISKSRICTSRSTVIALYLTTFRGPHFKKLSIVASPDVFHSTSSESFLHSATICLQPTRIVLKNVDTA